MDLIYFGGSAVAGIIGWATIFATIIWPKMRKQPTVEQLKILTAINFFRYFEGRGNRLWGARTISSSACDSDSAESPSPMTKTECCWLPADTSERGLMIHGWIRYFSRCQYRGVGQLLSMPGAGTVSVPF